MRRAHNLKSGYLHSSHNFCKVWAVSRGLQSLSGCSPHSVFTSPDRQFYCSPQLTLTLTLGHGIQFWSNGMWIEVKRVASGLVLDLSLAMASLWSNLRNYVLNTSLCLCIRSLKACMEQFSLSLPLLPAANFTEEKSMTFGVEATEIWGLY